MALGPGQQDALWLTLYNLHGMYILGQMERVASFEDDRDVVTRHAMVMSNFDQVLEIMNIINDVRRASRRTRTFFFSPAAMDVIFLSLHAHDAQHNTLSPTDLEIVRTEYAALRDLVATSMQHCYTREELRKVGIK